MLRLWWWNIAVVNGCTAVVDEGVNKGIGLRNVGISNIVAGIIVVAVCIVVGGGKLL